MSKNMNKRATENSILKFLTVSSVSSDNIVKGIIDDIIKTAVKTAEVNEQNIYNIYNNRVKLNRDIHFTYILRLLITLVSNIILKVYM